MNRYKVIYFTGNSFYDEKAKEIVQEKATVNVTAYTHTLAIKAAGTKVGKSVTEMQAAMLDCIVQK